MVNTPPITPTLQSFEENDLSSVDPSDGAGGAARHPRAGTELNQYDERQLLLFANQRELIQLYNEGLEQRNAALKVQLIDTQQLVRDECARTRETLALAEHIVKVAEDAAARAAHYRQHLIDVRALVLGWEMDTPGMMMQRLSKLSEYLTPLKS